MSASTSIIRSAETSFPFLQSLLEKTENLKKNDKDNSRLYQEIFPEMAILMKFYNETYQFCPIRLEGVVDFLMKKAPKMLNFYFPGIGRPLEMAVRHLRKENARFDGIIIKLLNYTRRVDGYKICKNFSKVSERADLNFQTKTPRCLGDQVTIVSTNCLSHDFRETIVAIPSHINVILKIAYFGKESIFEEILRSRSESDSLPSFKKFDPHFPKEIDRIIAGYSPFIATEARDVATLTCTTNKDDSLIIYETPFQQAIQGLLDLYSEELYFDNIEDVIPFIKNKTKEYIRLAKLILDSGETIDRCPYGASVFGETSIENFYGEKFPVNFFSKLKEAICFTDLDNLVEEVFDLMLSK